MKLFCCNSLKCVLVSDKECKVRLEILNINRKEFSFYPYSILVNKCSGSRININDTYANLCIPSTVKTRILKNLI